MIQFLSVLSSLLNILKDKIFIKGLTLNIKTGINPWEKHIKQPVLIDVSVACDLKMAARTCDLEHSINYSSLQKFILEFPEQKHFLLLENFAQLLSEAILNKFNTQGVTLKVSKPGATSCSQEIGIEISRTKQDA